MYTVSFTISYANANTTLLCYCPCSTRARAMRLTPARPLQAAPGDVNYAFVLKLYELLKTHNFTQLVEVCIVSSPNTYTHKHTHTHAHTCTHTYKQTHKHTHAHQTHTHMHTSKP